MERVQILAFFDELEKIGVAGEVPKGPTGLSGGAPKMPSARMAPMPKALPSSSIMKNSPKPNMRAITTLPGNPPKSPNMPQTPFNPPQVFGANGRLATAQEMGITAGGSR